MPDYSDLAYALGGYGKKSNPYDAQRKFSYGLMQQGSDASPIQSPWQGVSRLAQAMVGAYGLYKADEGEKAADTKRSDALAQAMAEPDPQKRMTALAAYDPDAGARAAGQWAVEQAKMNQQRQTLGSVADSYGQPPGSPPQQAGGGGMPAPLPQGAAPPSPQGFANNSGNIRSTAPGNFNGFATYPSPQAGANAQFGNFQAYVKENPNITVAQAIAKWAPPNENNTQGYIQRFAEATGINPGMPLAQVLNDPATAAIALDAQTRIEKGGLPQGFNADTFTRASGGPQGLPITVTPGQQPGAPQSLAVPQPVPPQGGGDGAPPSPSPQGTTGPAVVAAPTPPTKLSVQTAPQAIMAPYVQKLRSLFYGTGPHPAMKMEADAQHEFDRLYEGQKLEYEQKLGDYKSTRDQGLKQPQETTQNEHLLRTEFDNQQPVKDYRKASTVFQSVAKDYKTNTPAADLNMIYGFATLMDPGSVVREGEMGMVRATQSASDYVKGLISQFEGQGRLSPTARAGLMEQMASRYEALKGVHDHLATGFKGFATRSGMNPDNIVADLPAVNYKRGQADVPPPPPGFRPL